MQFLNGDDVMITELRSVLLDVLHNLIQNLREILVCIQEILGLEL